MEKVLRKFLYIIATINYPQIKRKYRYFIRDNYYSRILQTQFLFKDYFKKSKYKTIEFQGEFDQELRYVLPFAYWHYKNGTLKNTISSKHTKEFYFFSNDHQERHHERIWELGYSNFNIPNMTHNINFSYKKWLQVPFKETYKNNIFKYKKPILMIANKYNIEWNEAPLNYFDLPLLEWIINNYGAKYQIIYNRPLNSQIVTDNSDILDLKEHAWLHDKYPEVIQMNNLYKENRHCVNNYNHLQLLVYANCDYFISVHGGTAAFASYFGGRNIILSKKGIEHELGEFNTIFPALSNAKIYHAKSELKVKAFMKKYY